MTFQRTIQSDFTLKGKGLHSGEEVTLNVCPAPVNTGIVFVRTDLNNRPEIKVEPSSLSTDELSRCSMIQQGDAKVFTLEHLMAAFAGLGVDNVVVNIDGEEVPGLDGSSQDFVDAILEVGLKDYPEKKEFVRLKNPITLEYQGASISIEPAETLSITYTLDYPLSILKQKVGFTINEDVFVRDIAPARTFCLKQEAEALKAQGLGKGANTQNTLIIDEQGPENNTFRFPDECGRHKVLDCLGDLYLLGRPLKAHVKAVKSGHALNNHLVRKIAEQVSAAINN